MVVGITESYPKATRLVLNDHELITPIQCPLKPITWEMPASLAELGNDIPSKRSCATSGPCVPRADRASHCDFSLVSGIHENIVVNFESYMHLIAARNVAYILQSWSLCSVVGTELTYLMLSNL